ncbi:hypothetical protein PFICI_01096 [Pestalotiopsis fici W106-1]|uniref:Caib baif family enzyme n=1 Tax=Pestalotiopsis fici (strain W106-1 / CGMCC3.15140) TaxID=1229662 RepID=W3XMK7_PESFW|nr:uncharacterized protein PFICI_01096 [Pestalotiopsis fici W106-1]ETS87268.1 hypothetical protein PFICI_01096 [Pestalotiopsis fici W106-1]
MPLLDAQESHPPEPICNIVTPVGMLGYGFNEQQTAAALSRLVPSGTPTAIILDSGSTDSGPEKLALGIMTCPPAAYARDLTKLVRLVIQFRVPLMFSSAGGDGSDTHVQEIMAVIKEIMSADEYTDVQLKTIAIFAGIDKTLVKERLRNGQISGCGRYVPQLTEEDIEESSNIVAQLGPEPFVDAMIENPDFDIIVGGRAYDPSPYVAYAAFNSQAQLHNASRDEKQKIYGAFTHLGKIMECGGQCAKPKSHGAVGTLYSTGEFDISPLDPAAACTTLSVAAHTLYEKTRPDILHGPGGYLDLSRSKYMQMSDDRTVRVLGSSFHFSEDDDLPYTVKLEAALVVGYRTMFMGSIRDPILISQIDQLIARIKEYVGIQHVDTSERWKVDFHVHGRNTDEIFLVGEALADTQALATSIASTARIATMHGPYKNQKATSGNFAFGIGGKLEVEAGPCAEFSVYHLMELQPGEERLHPTPRTSSAPAIDSAGERLMIKHRVEVVGRGKRLSATQPSSSPKKQAVNLSANNATKVPRPASVSNQVSSTPAKLGDLASVLRSKNAGPYEITFDVIFESEDIYARVKSSGMLSQESVAAAFGLQVDQIIWCGFFDVALAFKFTIPRIRGGRAVAAGGFMENDVHGSQQYLPLFNMELLV